MLPSITQAPRPRTKIRAGTILLGLLVISIVIYIVYLLCVSKLKLCENPDVIDKGPIRISANNSIQSQHKLTS